MRSWQLEGKVEYQILLLWMENRTLFGDFEIYYETKVYQDLGTKNRVSCGVSGEMPCCMAASRRDGQGTDCAMRKDWGRACWQRDPALTEICVRDPARTTTPLPWKGRYRLKGAATTIPSRGRVKSSGKPWVSPALGRIFVDIQIYNLKRSKFLSDYGDFCVFIKFQRGVTRWHTHSKFYCTCFFCVDETHRIGSR